MDYCSNAYDKAKLKPSNLQAFYRTLRESEDRLHSTPTTIYKEKFIGIRTLFGLPEIELFTYQQCMDYCSNTYDKSKIKPTSLKQFYQTLREYEDRLPSTPTTIYKEKLIGIRTLFGLPEIDFFTYQQCMDYCSIAYDNAKIKPTGLYGFYQTLRESEDRLPSNPTKIYKEEYIGIRTIFSLPEIGLSTYLQCKDYCSNAYDNAKIKPTALHDFYQTLRESEDRLPSTPTTTYKEEFVGIRTLFGLPEIDFFTYQQCKDYCSNAYDNAKTKPTALHEFYHTLRESEDRLYSGLVKLYKEEFVGIRTLFGLPEIDFFNYQECKDYCSNAYDNAKTKSTSLKEYYQTLRESEDRLPYTPAQTYKEEFIGLRVLFGFYETIKKSFFESRKLCIQQYQKAISNGKTTRSFSDFLAELVQDGLVTINDTETHPRFESYEHFFGVDSLYKTLNEVQQTFFHYVLDPNKRTKETYLALADMHPKLPKNPKLYEDWYCWESFVSGEKKEYYAWEEFKNKLDEYAKSLHIKITPISYQALKKIDGRLHSQPEQYYFEKWKGWPDLSCINLYITVRLGEFSQNCIKAGLTQETTDNEYLEYRAAHRQPSYITKNPLIQFNCESFAKIIKFRIFNHIELNQFVHENKIKTKKELTNKVKFTNYFHIELINAWSKENPYYRSKNWLYVICSG